MARPPNLVKMSWEEVKDVVTRGDLAVLGRSKEQQEEYDTFYNKTKAEWRSIADFLLATKFDYEVFEDIQLEKKYVSRTDIVLQERLKFAPNDFPYYFEDGIDHFILWKLGGVITEEEAINAAVRLRNENSKYKDHVIYINPPHLKSIPEIEHAHVLLYQPFT